MIPRPDWALRMLAHRITATLLPQIGATYGRSDGGMVAMLMGYLAGEMESGVARRMADIADMQQILAEAARHGLVPPSLQSLKPAELTLSTVNACHAQLTSALIELHAALEVRPCPAPEVLAAIWRYLDEHSRRHQLD